jgi:prepilin-type N-terminal cleavage/methylation domain-containing protein
MMQPKTKVSTVLTDSRGFTLIEMAIVLIIIGIIIGAVVKGKDVIKSAEQKRLYSTFVREWQVAYNNYYDRTGWILGDDATNANTTRDGLCGNALGAGLATAANLDSQLRLVGLTPPAQGPTGLSNQRTYTDSFGRQFTLTLQFANNATFGNHIRISSTAGIPYDMGIAWDKIIDGSANGTTGDLLFDTNNNGTADAWPGNAGGALDPNDAIFLRLEF